MSRLSMTSLARAATVALLALGAAAGCATATKNTGGGPNTAIDATPTPLADSDAGTDGGAGTDGSGGDGGNSGGGTVGQPPTTTKTTPPAAPSWPTPADCVSYDPSSLTLAWVNEVFTVSYGTTVVLRVSGGSTDNAGDTALAVAQRYRKHCFLGRNNTREERNSYIFDYWRDASGISTVIPDQEDDCSPYNRNNLTVEDMGGGYGWRVKDHDHVLHLFDNGTDARNGKLVLQKYTQICSIGGSGEDDPQLISYSL